MNCIWTFSDSQHASGPLFSRFLCGMCDTVASPVLTGFCKPTRIPCLNTCPVVSMHQDNALRNEYAQIKTCYPRLRGILHIVTEDWLSAAFICNSERITHCCSGRIFLLVLCYFFCTLDTPFPLMGAKAECCSAHTGVKHWGTVWYMWVVEIFLLLLLQEGHSGWRVIRKLKRGY